MATELQVFTSEHKRSPHMSFTSMNNHFWNGTGTCVNVNAALLSVIMRGC